LILGDYVGKRVIVRADIDLLDSYRKDHPELEGVTYSALTDIILRKAIVGDPDLAKEVDTLLGEIERAICETSGIANLQAYVLSKIREIRQALRLAKEASP